MGVRLKLSSAPITHAENQEWNKPMQHLNDSLLIRFRVCAMSVFKLFQCGLLSLVVLEVLEGLLNTLIQDFKVINAMMLDQVVCENERVLYMKYTNLLCVNQPINMNAKRYNKEGYNWYSKTSRCMQRQVTGVTLPFTVLSNNSVMFYRQNPAPTCPNSIQFFSMFLQ